MRAVRAVALGFSLVSENRKGRCEDFPYDRFWGESLATAVCSQVLARKLRCGDPGEVFLVQDFLEVFSDLRSMVAVPNGKMSQQTFMG